MTDDDLRTALRTAHADDAPPRFGATMTAAQGRRGGARWKLALGLGVAVAAVAAVLLLVRRPAVPPPLALDTIGMRATSLRMPLDSLLSIPDQDLLSTAPDLRRGVLP